MSKQPPDLRMESNIYLGYTMDATDCNMSDFFKANTANLEITDAAKLINDSPNPNYFGTETKIENTVQSGSVSADDEISLSISPSFRFEETKVLFRYVVVGCAFYSDKEKQLSFSLSVEDSDEARVRSIKEGELIYSR